MADSGMIHLAMNPRNFEPQRENAFQFIVTDIDNIVNVSANVGDATNTIANAQEVLRYSLVSATVPTFSQNVEQISRGNATLKFAGKPEFNALTLVFNEFVDSDSKGALLSWQAKSYNAKSQGIGDVSDYKKDCYLLEYTQNYEKLIRTWHIVGGWIKGIDDGSFSHDSSGLKTITATLEYDWAYIEE